MGAIPTEGNGISNSNSTQSGELTAPQKAQVKAWWKKVITATKVDHKLSAPTDKTVFGLPLLHSIRYAHTTISYHDETTNSTCMAVIPTTIAKCGSHLKEKGLEIEGIFRLSGNSKRIGQLQSLFDASYTQYGVYLDWDDYSIHDVANVMRRFLNHLPEPVIPLNHYQLFKSTMETEFVSTDAKTQAFQNLIDQMPLVHQFLLLYLLDLLSLFTLTSHLTRMDISCLASVFAPGILSHPDDALNPSGYKESQLVLEYLIKHQDKFRMPRSRIPFIKSECIFRPPLQAQMIQHSLSTPTNLVYTGSDAIHPLHTANSASPAPFLETKSSSGKPLAPMSASPFYANHQSSKSMNQINQYAQLDTVLPTPTSSSASIASSTSSTSIRRHKTLPTNKSTPALLSSSSSASTSSLYTSSTNSVQKPTWRERSTGASLFRRARQQSNPKSTVHSWKSIRTVSTMERDGLHTPIFTQ